MSARLVWRTKQLATERVKWCQLLANGSARLVCRHRATPLASAGRYHRRWLSSTTRTSATSEATVDAADDSTPKTMGQRLAAGAQQPVLVEERRYSGETRFSMPKPMDVKPIAAIVPKNRVEKIVKYESFIERNFLGEFDKDFLTFPILLKTRQEFLDMSDQHEMVRRLFARLPKDDGTLDSLALRSLHELTVSEMVYVFEAMGAAQQSRLAFGGVGAEERRRLNPDADARFVSLPVNQLSAELSSLTANKSIVEQLIPLVIHNALSYYAIDNSSNEPLRQELLASRPKIGFAYCEPNDNLGALPYVHWESRAKLTNDCDAWLVNGSKSRIFKDNYDYYMVFCRSEDFPGEPTTAIIGQKDQYGIVTLLVPKDMVTVEDDGTDSYGIEYQRIRFDDLLLSRDTHELIKSEAKATTALNVKACGQVVSGAIVLGVLKQLLRNTYDYVVNERVGLTECEITQKMLAEATRKIYAIESMTYLTAAMFDSFQTGADFSLESIAVKTLATEYAYDVVKNLRSIYGSRYLVSSTAHDLINVFDSFLDCAINNRMYLALRGVRNQGQWRHDHIRRLRLSPLYPVYMLKHYIGAIKSRRDNIDLDLDLCGFVHPNLKPAAEWLEYCLKKLDYSSNGLLIRHGKNIINKQQDLYRLATISMDVYMMTAVISRASHSLVTGLRNSDIDKEVAVALSLDAFLNTTKMLDEMSGHTDQSNDSRNTMIHNRNVKYDGYFAMPTIDRII